MKGGTAIALQSGRCLVAVLLATLTATAQAWGAVGHRAVGGIADRLLDEQAHAQVALLLADDRDNEGNPSGRTTLAEVSTWADEIRHTPADRPSRHYDDIAVCGAVPATASWCPADGECASQQISQLLGVLRDATKPLRERNEALKWIVHLVGDIHQPLHAASNFYAAGVLDESGHATDRGGNDVTVALEGVKTRGKRELHGVWDNDLVNLSLGLRVTNRAGPTDALIDRLAQQARAIPPNRLSGSALQWTIESNALARKVAYNFVGFNCNRPANGIVVLDTAYIEAAKQLIPRQLEIAGARLAALLNANLGKGAN